MLEASDLKDSKCRVEYGPGVQIPTPPPLSTGFCLNLQKAALLDHRQNTELAGIVFCFILLRPKSKRLNEGSKSNTYIKPLTMPRRPALRGMLVVFGIAGILIFLNIGEYFSRKIDSPYRATEAPAESLIDQFVNLLVPYIAVIEQLFVCWRIFG